jgi:hypothetical protein
MMRHYAEILRDNDMVLTHREGMGWSIEDGIKLSYSDLEELEQILPLRAKKLTSAVYAMQLRTVNPTLTAGNADRATPFALGHSAHELEHQLIG